MRVFCFYLWRQDVYIVLSFYDCVWRLGKPQIKRRTSGDKFRNSLANFKEWCKENRSLKIRDLIGKLNKKLRGYYEYYGIIVNSKSLKKFYVIVRIILRKWLNRRSQRKSYSWQGYAQILKQYPLLEPRITETRNYQLTIF